MHLSSKKSDDGVLERVDRAEPGAFEELLERFKPMVVAIACHRCPSPNDIEDAVQEVFIEIWKSCGRYDPEKGSERSFVATVARRRLIDRFRRQVAQPELEELSDRLPARDGAVGRKETTVSVVAALDRLSPAHRQLVEMSLLEGYSHSEISASTALPLGTVKSIVRRSLHRIRSQLTSGLSVAQLAARG